MTAGPTTTQAPTAPGDERRRATAVERRLLAFQAREHEALARVARMAAEGVSPEQVFAVVAEQLVRLMDVEAGIVWRFDPDASVVVGSCGRHMSGVGVRFPVGGRGALTTVRATGRPARVDYASLDPDDPTARRLARQGYRSGVAAPIRVRGEAWGAVLAATTGDTPLDPAAEERLGRFAELVGLAICEAEARRDLTRNARDHSLLRRMATLVAHETDVTRLAETVVADVAHVLGSTEVSIRLAGAVVARSSRPRPPGGPQAPEDDLRLSVPIRTGLRDRGTVEAVVPAEPDAGRAPRLLEEIADLLALAVIGAEHRTRAMPDRDNLTGLPHHRAFHERLGEEVRRAHRHGRRLSLILADLDHFASVNQAHGHEAGDRLLEGVAERLADMARPGDSVARIGGGQFAWILPECDELTAFEAAERLRLRIVGEPFPTVGAATISAGVCDLRMAADGEQLYRRAGGALYWAKRHGRDRVFLYAPDVVDALSAEERAEHLERQRALSGVRMMARVVDAKDPATRRHSERVAAISVAIATEMGWAPERAALLHEAGLVHDVGKIGVPDAVLFTTDPLTEHEFAQIRDHAALGAKIVAEVLTPEQTGWVRSHHERCDGRGYPDGTAGAGVPDGARILAVADSWDVMTVARHYSAPMPIAQAARECRDEAGAQFCPEVVDALERLLADGAEVLGHLDGSGAREPVATYAF